MSPETEGIRNKKVNELLTKTFDIKDNLPREEWWNSTTNVLDGIAKLQDYDTPTPSILYYLSYSFSIRKINFPKEASLLQETTEQVIIPLWERELEREDNYLSLTGSTLEFYSFVDNDRSRKHIKSAIQKLQESLPPYSQIASIFPDVNDPSYSTLTNLFRFCDLGKEFGLMISICEENHWTEETTGWQEIKKYFDRVLLEIDLVETHPALINHLEKYIFDSKTDSKLQEQIKERLRPWKFARDFIYQDEKPDWRSIKM
jgi:hypothetical protein